MSTYSLDAWTAKASSTSHVISYSRHRLPGSHTVVDVKSPDELRAAKNELAIEVLALNDSLSAVAVDHTPVGRHGRGCKDVAFNMIVERPTD